MNASTGDLQNTGEFSTNPFLFRNALSTAKKRKPFKLNLKPLTLEDIEKELREAEEKPNFDDDDLLLEADNKENNKEHDVKKEDSFSLDFSALKTPEVPKTKHVTKTDHEFVTPQIATKLFQRSESKKPVSQLVTPKIQYSMNINDVLKSIEKPTRSLRKSQNGSIAGKLFDTIDEEPKEEIFKKMYVNKVEYYSIALLGRGGSSQVWQCFNKANKSFVAIKCVSLESPCNAQSFINEVNLLKMLQTCNRVIKMYDFEIKNSEKMLYVVLEVGGTDLHKILKEDSLDTTGHMPILKILSYWMDMLYAVKQIHQHGIIHSDLKPANFVQVNSILKLIDFGIATAIRNDVTSVVKSVAEGSFNYISPEALINDNNTVNSPTAMNIKYKISLKSDVWSLGCILYQLVYKRTPFQHIKHVSAKLSTIMDPKHVIEYPKAEWVPPRFIETIKKCLQFHMRLRPTVSELISEYENAFINF